MTEELQDKEKKETTKRTTKKADATKKTTTGKRGRPPKHAATKKETVKKTTAKRTAKKEDALVIKEDPKDIVLDDKKLEKIEEEIKELKSIPEEEIKKLYFKTFKNILIGALIVLFFLFVNIGFFNIPESSYLVDLKVFSAIILITTIVIFEKAYKKDDDEKAIHGMEMLVLSIATLLTLYIYDAHYSKFISITNAIAILFALYYAIKATVKYVKIKKKIAKENSDVRKIIKK